MERVGATVAMEVIIDEFGTSERPFILVAPLVATHDEEPDGAITEAVFGTFAAEDAFEPFAINPRWAEMRSRPEIDHAVSVVRHFQPVMMAPGPEQQFVTGGDFRSF